MRDLNEKKKKKEYLKFIVSLQHSYCVLSKILYKMVTLKTSVKDV